MNTEIQDQEFSMEKHNFVPTSCLTHFLPEEEDILISSLQERTLPEMTTVTNFGFDDRAGRLTSALPSANMGVSLPEIKNLRPENLVIDKDSFEIPQPKFIGACTFNKRQNPNEIPSLNRIAVNDLTAGDNLHSLDVFMSDEEGEEDGWERSNMVSRVDDMAAFNVQANTSSIVTNFLLPEPELYLSAAEIKTEFDSPLKIAEASTDSSDDCSSPSSKPKKKYNPLTKDQKNYLDSAVS